MAEKISYLYSPVQTSSSLKARESQSAYHVNCENLLSVEFVGWARKEKPRLYPSDRKRLDLSLEAFAVLHAMTSNRADWVPMREAIRKTVGLSPFKYDKAIAELKRRDLLKIANVGSPRSPRFKYEVKVPCEDSNKVCQILTHSIIEPLNHRATQSMSQSVTQKSNPKNGNFQKHREEKKYSYSSSLRVGDAANKNLNEDLSVARTIYVEEVREGLVQAGKNPKEVDDGLMVFQHYLPAARAENPVAYLLGGMTKDNCWVEGHASRIRKEQREKEKEARLQKPENPQMAKKLTDLIGSAVQHVREPQRAAPKKAESLSREGLETIKSQFKYPESLEFSDEELESPHTINEIRKRLRIGKDNRCLQLLQKLLYESTI